LDREAGLEREEATQFPAADDAIHHAVDVGAISASAAKRYLPVGRSHEAMGHVVLRECPFQFVIERVLEAGGAAEPCQIAGSDGGVVNHLGPGVVGEQSQ